MADIVFHADSYEVLLEEAKRLGFVYKDEHGHDRILENGPLKSGGAFALNYVGKVLIPTGNVVQGPLGDDEPELEPLPGVWGRLRVNGLVSDLPEFSSAITQYFWDQSLGPKNDLNQHSGAWTSDGQNIAPDYVRTIGQMM